MDIYEASAELAKNIIKGVYWDNGHAIERFHYAIIDGETPRMALALVKQSFWHTPENMPKT